MLRINRMSDYGMLILGDLALRKDAYVSATDIASSTHIALPTVQKLLKKLHQKELVLSKQGPLGGYALHDSAKLTSVAMIIQALEGLGLSATLEYKAICQFGYTGSFSNKKLSLYATK